MRVIFVVSLSVSVLAGCSGSETVPEPQPAIEPVALVFETHHLEKQTEGCAEPMTPGRSAIPDGSDPSGNCARVHLSWVEIAQAPEGVARDAIDRWVHGVLLAPAIGDAPHDSPEALADDFLARFETFQRDFPDAPGGWYVERSIETLHHDDSVVGFRVVDSSFTGGAHPNTFETYTSLYLTTGRPVALDDLLVAGNRERLLEIAERRFRQVRGLAADEDLGEAGFWFSGGPGGDSGDSGEVTFELTDNFALTADGLLFHYNPYDIAPYALGPTTLEIARAELDGAVSWPE